MNLGVGHPRVEVHEHVAEAGHAGQPLGEVTRQRPKLGEDDHAVRVVSPPGSGLPTREIVRMSVEPDQVIGAPGSSRS
jgi:hypothetical protein